RLVERTDAPGRLCAAAPREVGQPLERGTGAAIMIDECAESARADILAADEPKPIESLAVRELHRGDCFDSRHGFTAGCPILVSVPAMSRAMLARCITKARTVMTKNNIASPGLPSA